MQIVPIETQVFDGLIKRFTQVFQCPAIITTTQDKTRTLERMQEGRALEYPFAFLTIQSVAHNKEQRQSAYLSRRGIPIAYNNVQTLMSRLVPANFNVEVEFRTTKFSGIEATTVMGYAKRWLFAYKCGMLKFNVQHGQLPVRIGITMDDTVPTPPLENKLETETCYKITSNLVVHGWVSEPELGTQGVVQEFELETLFGAQQGYTFVPFD
jgi:hypothetical protein